MSSRRPIRSKEVLNPSRIQSNMIKDYVDGNLDDYNFLYRASVFKIDNLGGQLEQDPPNPKNSIKARIITSARNKYLSNDELPVFWPLFPHDIMPVKEGEHVYVFFEDANRKSHGLWIARVSEPKTTDSANLSLGIKKYQENSSNDITDISAEKDVQDSDIDFTSPQVSDEFIVEDVPNFQSRIGDRVLEGSNNTLIVLGRDRITNISSGEREVAGTIDLVSGRVSGSVDVNMDEDKSRIYLSMKTNADGNFSIDVGPPGNTAASIILASDQVRILAKDKGSGSPSIKIVSDGDVYLEGKEIFQGKDATESAVLGDKLVTELGKIIDTLVNGPIGQLGSLPIPTNPAIIAGLNGIKVGLQNILSLKNKIK